MFRIVFPVVISQKKKNNNNVIAAHLNFNRIPDSTDLAVPDFHVVITFKFNVITHIRRRNYSDLILRIGI